MYLRVPEGYIGWEPIFVSQALSEILFDMKNCVRYQGYKDENDSTNQTART